MYVRVSPPGMQDWLVTADGAISAVSHAVVKQIQKGQQHREESLNLTLERSFSPYLPSQHSGALERLSSSLPMGCPQWLHLQSCFYFIPHFSVEVLQSLTLRQGDWLEKTHCTLPCDSMSATWRTLTVQDLRISL